MTASPGFIAFVEDALAPVGGITPRRMFGGAGLYCEGVFFAIVSGDVLYFRTDEAGREAFEAEGMEPFRYDTKARQVTVGSYYRAPERLFDDPDELVAWARTAIAIARREAAAKTTAKAKGTAPAAERTARKRSPSIASKPKRRSR